MASPADPFEITDDPVSSPAEGAESPPARRAVASTAHLEGLNDEQRLAVIHQGGPLLVLAGAGTGKTRVLTTRIAHLLITGRARPSQVLAVTFTNKAAREMLDRVASLIGGAADGMWLGTFHAIGVRVLRRHAELVGLKSNFTILDTDDQTRLIKQLLQAEGIDDKKWPARVLSGIIQRWKDRALTPDKVSGEDAGEFANGRAADIYRQYQERLAEVNAVDFGDLVMHCVTLWQKHPDVLAQYHRRFRHILVDEYQDTNVAQYLWLRLLAQGTQDVCCVGDDDQSIYGWRGAEVGNILRFEKDFPGATIVRLERNYRSTPHILAAASHLIAHNEGRLGKTLWTEMKEGERISLRGVWDGDEEARTIGEEIEALQRDKHALSQIAILVRAGFQTREFEERFITMGLPYRVIGGPRFYERQEIRDAMAYCRVTVQPDDDLAFERIYNTPRRGLGELALRTLRLIQRAQKVSLFEATRRALETDELKGRQRKSLGDLIRSFDRWRAMLDGMNHVEVVETMLDESGYTDMLRARPLARGRGPAREPEGAHQRAAGIRHPARLPRARGAADRQCRASRQRHGERHDPARRQGPGVRHRVPAGLGGRPVPQPARARRQGRGRARGGAAAGLCRADARAQAGLCLLRRQPARLQPVAGRHPVALPARTADRPAGREQRRRPLRHLFRRPSRRPARPGERLRLRKPGRHDGPGARAGATRRSTTAAPSRATRSISASASGCSTRSSAMAASSRSTATSSTSSSRRPARRRSWTASSRRRERWKASFVRPAIERLPWEEALEHLTEDGFVVTSREISRDGPWRIEIFGEAQG